MSTIEDIEQFLHARYEEERRDALSAAQETMPNTGSNSLKWYATDNPYEGIGILNIPFVYPHDGLSTAMTEHIERYDPKRALAEVRAKHLVLLERPRLSILMALASVYQGHPDYRQSWKPHP